MNNGVQHFNLYPLLLSVTPILRLQPYLEQHSSLDLYRWYAPHPELRSQSSDSGGKMDVDGDTLLQMQVHCGSCLGPSVMSIQLRSLKRPRLCRSGPGSRNNRCAKHVTHSCSGQTGPLRGSVSLHHRNMSILCLLSGIPGR
jgi:hypothetical protein